MPSEKIGSSSMATPEKWPHRYYVVVPAASLANGKQLFVNMGKGLEANRASLACQLSGTGAAPATHYAAATHATEAHRLRLDAAEKSGQLPTGLKYYRVDNDDVLLKTNSLTAAGKVGQVFTFSDVLADLLLKQIAVAP